MSASAMPPTSCEFRRVSSPRRSWSPARRFAWWITDRASLRPSVGWPSIVSGVPLPPAVQPRITASHGLNGIDDGGHILPNRRHWKEDAVPFDEQTVGPPPPPNRYMAIDRVNPRDIGFRLWNVDARKKQAKVYDEPFNKDP